jgi:hypothetical protein
MELAARSNGLPDMATMIAYASLPKNGDNRVELSLQE